MDRINTDILIVGAGAAGIRAAVAAMENDAKVILLAERSVAKGGATFSTLSKGWGIQALVGGERNDGNLEAFYNDIMNVGLGECDPVLVRIMVEESGDRLRDLISWGLRFRKDENGDYHRATGCFSEEKRAFITEDFGNIRRSFTSMLRQHNAGFMTGVAMDLIIDNGECRGALVLSKEGELVGIAAKSTILATGGGAGIYRDHFVRDGATGDGYALAHRAGAELKNMEFVQFALGMRRGGMRGFLPIHHLTDDQTLQSGDGRDVLALEIPDGEKRTGAVNLRRRHMPFSSRDHSFLIDAAVAHARKSDTRVYWHQMNDTEKPFEVKHFAHAFNGGIKIDEKAESTIPGLFAAGEVAAGPHGADRIGGCMMTATQVFGRRAGMFAAMRAKNGQTPERCPTLPEWNAADLSEPPASGADFLNPIEDAVRDSVNEHLMICRTASGLKSCLSSLESYGKSLEMLKGAFGRTMKFHKLRNMIATGALVARSALMRPGSKGSHHRDDDPGSST